MGLWDDIRAEFEKSQATRHFVIEGERMPRIAFGDETNRMSLMRCPECDSGPGSFHMLGCTVEECPLCEGPACNCACAYEKRPRELMGP